MHGGVRPGDTVVIDPSDPWMLSKIRAGFLVPLDPKWSPPEEPSETPQNGAESSAVQVEV